jgi:hypothetical protein
MTLQQLPVTGLDDPNHRRRHREITNKILTHQFDDSKVQTAAERLAEVTPVNYAYPPGDIRRYGAKVDGVADDSAAVQAAINSNRNVYIPRGTCYLGTTGLTVAIAEQRIHGDGVSSVLQWSTGFTGVGITVTADHFQAQDFCLDKPLVGSIPGAGCIGIDNQSHTSELINIKVFSSGSSTWQGWGYAVQVVNFVHKFTHCRFTAARRALNSLIANYVEAVNCNFSSQAHLGDMVVYFNGGSANSIAHCDIEGDADYAVYVDDGGGASTGNGTLQITGCYIEGQDTAIFIEGTTAPGKDVRGVSIIGNFISGNVATCLIGIQANRVSGLHIAGNCIINHQNFGVIIGAAATAVEIAGNHLSSTAGGWTATSIDTAAIGRFELYAGRKQVVLSGNYTLLLSDNGRQIYQTSALATITIPANASVPLAVGAELVLINNSSGNLTVAITSDTLVFAPSGATGSRTMVPNSVAFLHKVGTTGWFIWGVGLT